MADGTAPPDDLASLMAQLRPDLHRYCARMVGSAFEGEDVVQDALAKAVQAWTADAPPERPRSWLFRIAHNTALDALRHRRRQAALRARLDPDRAVEGADARVAAAAGLATLMQLSAAQRSCVVLVDVLGHSLDETTQILQVTGPAAKAALHRGRGRLRVLAAADEAVAPAPLDAATARRLRAYADRFNARDFDALRALLAEDVRLDLVDRRRLEGAKDVGVYFTRYSELFGWRMEAGLAEGRPAMLVRDPADPTGAVAWVVLLDFSGDRIAAIRDFFYARYVMDGLSVTPL